MSSWHERVAMKNEPREASRKALRQELIARRAAFAQSSQITEAQVAISAHLRTVLEQLEPDVLGLYSPIASEFNPIHAVSIDCNPQLALPFAQREPVRMHYRLWDGAVSSVLDECGIASSDGKLCVPDVILVPCVGFTAQRFRLGYGGGYFDRWLALNPGVTAIGVAWSNQQCEFASAAHDQALDLIVTEQGVFS